MSSFDAVCFDFYNTLATHHEGRGRGKQLMEYLQLHGFESDPWAHQLGAAKPDPAIFMEACRKLGTTPARTLHVGDTFVDDFEGAKAAGFRAVLIDRSAQSTETSVERISSLEEILPLL